MIVKDITTEIKEFAEVERLHETSFPPNERYSMDEIFDLLKMENVKYKAFFDEDTLVGTLFYIVGEQSIYLFYLTVKPYLRSKGYGSQILQWAKENYRDKTITLNVEPVEERADNAEQREKRLQFYLKNGFKITNLILDDDSGQYSILATSEEIDTDEYKELILQLGFGSYNPKIEKVSCR